MAKNEYNRDVNNNEYVHNEHDAALKEERSSAMPKETPGDKEPTAAADNASRQQNTDPNYRPRTLSSALDGISDRMNNQFDKMDMRKKGILILTIAVCTFIIGLIYLYHFLTLVFD